MTDKNPLSVAIVGGGIAGVTLTIALLQKCPHMQVTLYESASAFGEIGAGVGFQPVMVRTMNLIDPRIGAAFDKCSKGNDDVYDPPLWFRMRVGDERKEDVKLGEQIFELPARKGPRGGVHRAHFLDELVKLVPEGVAQFKKKLVDVAEGEDDDVLLKFADGSTARHSVVLGCDGIKSRTRPIVLKGDSEAAKAVFSGKYAYLVAFSSKPTWGDPNWVVSTSREDMLEDYKHWSPAVRAIMDSLQKPDIWALFNHPPAPTYYTTKPLICLVGDAAHASTPHQGAGAGMCIEDAYILSELLSQCHTKSDLQKAFYAYDAVRRPRTQKLVKTSREAGMLWDFEGEGIGDDLEALEKNATTRMSWIWDHEILGDLAMAKDMMAEA
ncbi:hypothetical protein A1F97_02042 [Pyrenophora tritici-repentis]|uniref:UbiH, 2-polyprenyl-6-methoxyphenol hydroxylase and related FAD-dependent oxidoreductase n=1 Tax=Pyrenophora tritici-repentis TaxID=45151 RepID=A0A2W1H838_9PLEO|nr:UbiH 2-polyprenyl-6-methoxyphenol hydroxylase [Pyrenophora tritici-repentis]KAF7573221.1 UbiH, 2-polyprenyl-6-methoxyphenol hydroxylase and related FAD-dependent oxidoreductase [Pyrenophora tritici-repentis]PZD33141.1 hypothetical protein A1F96_02380 [Pyrenophora tritici-repentis]PZD44626.1 hypothetical protein A1F97_02042 [Pyrenophora tritici-repentis]